MARTCEVALVLTVVLISFFQSDAVFDRVLDDVSSCVQACTNTYSPHTYDKGYLIDSCKRGCRFFSIMELIYCSPESVNITQQGCKSSCEEAYNKTEEYDACNFGCKSQIPHFIEKQKEDELIDPSIHLMYPFMYVHNMYSNMIDKVYNGMSVSWSFYMQADDGKVVVIKSQPQIYIQTNLGEGDDEYNTANYFETNLESVDRSATPVLKNSQLYGFQDGDDLELSLSDFDEQNSSDWLSCVSKKTGLPRLFLSLVLLSCAVMMIWLCLTASVTSPDHKVKQEYKKLSINGDLEYLRELEALGLKPSYPQGPDDAKPLPLKIKVQRI